MDALDILVCVLSCCDDGLLLLVSSIVAALSLFEVCNVSSCMS